MRGPALVIAICGLLFCGACLAQKVQFTSIEKPLILQRMKSVPETNAARVSRLKELFTEAGCNGNCIVRAKSGRRETPNIVCLLGTGKDDTLIVGAHYERTTSTQTPLDNWSGASLLPAIYQSLRNKKRNHNFIFVAFADNGKDPTGAEFLLAN